VKGKANKQKLLNNQLSEDEPRVEAVTSHSVVDHEFSIEVRFLVALLVPSLSNMFFQTHLARASFACCIQLPSQSTYLSVLQETQSVSDAGGPVVFQARQAKGSMTSSSVF